MGVSLRDGTLDLFLVSWYNVSSGHKRLCEAHLWVTGLDANKAAACVRVLLSAKGTWYKCSRRCAMAEFLRDVTPLLLVMAGLLVVMALLFVPYLLLGKYLLRRLIRFVKDSWD